VGADEFVTLAKKERTPTCWRRSGKFDAPSIAEEFKMDKAKLIKRKEWLERERERIAQRQARLSAAALLKADASKNWVKRYQATPKPNSRELFAALFAQPQAS